MNKQNKKWDEKYQDGFKNLKEGEVCPPCPVCDSIMEPWDAWLVTGAKCSNSKCGWNISEGSGCCATMDYH